VDRAIGDKWLVTGGLNAGDRVIMEGRQKVRPGMEVRAVPFTGDATGAPAGGEEQSTPQAAAEGNGDV
jgi:membrane fusion protein (multidrug efflux system)